MKEWLLSELHIWGHDVRADRCLWATDDQKDWYGIFCFNSLDTKKSSSFLSFFFFYYYYLSFHLNFCRSDLQVGNIGSLKVMGLCQFLLILSVFSSYVLLS